MPYASGEIPVVGDYVKNRWEQPGTVKPTCQQNPSNERGDSLVFNIDEGPKAQRSRNRSKNAQLALTGT
jgi:hypothetical protein